MAPKPDQFYKDKFSKFLQENNEDNVYSDDEYDNEDNLPSRFGGLSIPHDEDLDAPLNTRTGLGSLGGRSLGGRGLGGRGIGGLGGRSLGGLGGLGGRGIRGGGMMSRGASSSGLGGLGRGRTSQSLSSSDNVKATEPRVGVSTNVPTSGEDLSLSKYAALESALGDIAKGTTALQKEVAAFISDSQQRNVEAFKEILHFVHGLEDRTVVHFKELSRASAIPSVADETPVDEALQALLTNIDKSKNTDTAYILLPTSNSNSDGISQTSELSKLLGVKNVQIVDSIRSMCDKIMSVNAEPPVSEEAEDKPTTSLPVQIANITPAPSPSKGFPPLRSPIIK